MAAHIPVFNHGQVCSPLSPLQNLLHALILQVLPLDGTSYLNIAVYAVLLFFMGVSIAAAAPACNNPVFAEIVPPELRNMVRCHGTHARAHH
jgi:hypothetical protein